MLTFKRVNGIKIKYCSTDSYYENIVYKFIIDDKEIKFNLDDFEDIATLLLKLYVKAKNKENYRCCEELEACFELVLRIVHIENDRIIFRTWARNMGDEGVECIVNRTDFMQMLENVFDSLLADPEYIKLITTHEYYNHETLEEMEEDKRLDKEYFQMLKDRVLYDYADKDIEDYNMDNPNNIFNRHMFRNE